MESELSGSGAGSQSFHGRLPATGSALLSPRRLLARPLARPPVRPLASWRRDDLARGLLRARRLEPALRGGCGRPRQGEAEGGCDCC